MAVEIKAQKRDKFRKSASKQYRQTGLIPAIIYGQGDNKNILINDKEFTKLTPTLTKATIINLKLDDGNALDVLIKDYQKDHMRNKFVHIDFYELKAGKPVHVKIRLNYLGNPAGVREGGVLEKHLLELNVECLPKDIVPSINVKIDALNINDSLHVRDIKLDERYKVLSHLDEVLVHVSGKTASEEELGKPQAEIDAEAAATAAAATAAAESEEKKEGGAETPKK
jgi:large subunit ribosomal protein L25